MTALGFLLATVRLALQGIGAYVVVLVTLDEVWWTRRRYWRHLGVCILALAIMVLLQWSVPAAQSDARPRSTACCDDPTARQT